MKVSEKMGMLWGKHLDHISSKKRDSELVSLVAQSKTNVILKFGLNYGTIQLP